LARAQARIADSFETWHLLKPGPAVYTGDIYDSTITVLTGTNPAFRKIQVQVVHPLNSSRLYLLNGSSPRALELIPLVRVLAGPKTGEDACYFYSRLRPNGSVRWISYHFDAEPELILTSDDVREFLSGLRGV
jgi:hypothetical protein